MLRSPQYVSDRVDLGLVLTGVKARDRLAYELDASREPGRRRPRMTTLE
jgi:hypothetical protein